MLVRLDLALMTEAAGRMVTEAAGRMVTGEVVGLVEEDREGIRLLGCLKILLRSQV